MNNAEAASSSRVLAMPDSQGQAIVLVAMSHLDRTPRQRRFGRCRPTHEGREIRRSLPERRQMTLKRGDGRRREDATAAKILGYLVEERHGFTGVQHHMGMDGGAQFLRTRYS
ncbi:hypothetical protein [Sinorhizobium meliloti]|uniref:hypothetical protein n=1 Tax=Rhizobium meliloti TaxID=382 RepID=UPI001295DA0E|nr:hypothetical protein [Sinorhizobium meliloti]MDW9377934.1 hypothetical protein [Sinorhizobium meliloti]MDW9495829.1 hypothetical protein [Sinorhizobium meliloti]MDW9564860.1 hypothetical protein [Sinorhizobium meliloti]MDW9652317.1 hypothetical protein [Sinorhizobium meliloti]MDW9862725.1 hypothetical protein [Sinorhizobium meliloti]